MAVIIIPIIITARIEYSISKRLLSFCLIFLAYDLCHKNLPKNFFILHCL